MSDDVIISWALAYAARGLPVFPLHSPITFGPKRGDGRATCSCGSATCESQGKHPRTAHGLDDATVDPAVITAWWAAWPDANIGVRTGVRFDVLDLDGDEALDALYEFAPLDGAPVRGPMVLTGRGVHIYVPTTGAGNRSAMGSRPGLDWRGLGGYVVAPPSVHHLHGDRYEWCQDFGLDFPLVPLESWLLDLVHKRPPASPVSGPATRQEQRTGYGAKALEGELGRLATATEGARNDTLNTCAFRLGQLVAGGELGADEVTRGLVTVALRIGLGETEAARTITSGMREGMRTPRKAAA